MEGNKKWPLRVEQIKMNLKSKFQKMDRIFPYRSKQFLREAKECLEKMATSQDVDEVERAFLSFLNASRFCTNQLLTEYKNKLDGFNEWWEEKAAFLDKNELCSMFRGFRNKVTKAGEKVLEIHWELGGPTAIQGPIQLGPNGIMKLTQNDQAHDWMPLKHENFKITGIKFIGSSEFNTITQCNEYLKILEDLINEFIQKFCSI